MLKEKQIQLKEKLKIILAEVGHRDDIKQKIGEEFIGRNLSSHRAMNLFMGNEPIETLSDSEYDIRFLFLFVHSLNNALDGELKINVADFFTQLECRQWEDYREEDEPRKIYPIVFKGMQQIGDRIWQGKITAQRLDTLDANNILLYNFMTQRSPKITVSGVKINFDKNKSFAIKDRMLEGKQYPDHIKLNILNNFQEKINYDPKSETLIIGEGSIINIFDGYHRKVANSLAVDENPELDFTWGLIITNLSEQAAKDYMVQIDKQKPIKKDLVKSWDMDKYENQVVSVISDNRISKLAKVMKDQEAEIKHNKGLVTKNIIAEAIKENYEIDETTDIRALGNWIVEFTDYFMGLYPEEFITNPYATKESNLINHKNMFYSYIALSAKLRDNSEWKDVAKQKIQSVDFNISNDIWANLGMLNSKRANKVLRRKLYNLLTKGV